MIQHSPFTQPRPNQRGPGLDSRGFALLITVVLVAFLVLIIVTLATLVRVETSIAANDQKVVAARQNAMFALNVALGQLQETAGLDSRITATATLLDSSSANRDWTGVWALSTATGTVTTTAPIKWLVSGNNTPDADLTSLKNDPTAIRLLSAGTPLDTGGYDRDVWVQRQRLRSQDVPGLNSKDVTIGTYAYYVSDEGVKASLAPLPDTDLTHDYYDSPVARYRLSQLGGRSPAGFLDVPGFDGFSNAVQTRLARILDPEQFSFLSPGTITSEVLRERRHDFTTGSLGLLVDTTRGRLKHDLSVKPETMLGAAVTPYLAGMTPDRAQATSGATTTITPPTPASTGGELSYIAAPVITEFSFQAAVYNGPGNNPPIALRRIDSNLETRARFFFELWNPYTDTLVIPEDQDLRILIRNLPEVTVETQSSTGAKSYGSATINFGSVYNNTPTTDVVALIFRPDDLVNLPGGGKAMVSGRIYSAIPPPSYAENAEEDIAKQTLTRWSTFARNTYWNRLSGSLSGGTNIPDAEMQFRLTSANPTNIELTLQLGSEADGWTDLSTVKLPEFIPAQTPWLTSTDRFPRLGFHVKMGERSSTGGGANWLVNAKDFRRTNYTEDSFAYAIDDDPASYTTDVPASTSATEKLDLFNRDDSTTKRHHYDLALYELPRQEWVSVGSLQQLAFTNGSTPDKNYALGNSWADDRNQWFDRYYFSTLPASTSGETVTTELPNWNLQRVNTAPTGSLPTDEALRAVPDKNAGNFLVKDAFNINSTSSEAWRSVLAGMQLSNWTYAQRDGTTGQVVSSGAASLSSPFFRFSQSAAETWDIAGMPDTPDINGIRRFYRQGARSLTATQINALAQAIVAEIRSTRATRGPFASIKEFLSPATPGGENILERAIAATDASTDPTQRINYDPVLDTEIDPLSPSALSSADIMTALAPIVSPRSDTFVIRTYGAATDVLDPLAAATDGALPPANAEAWLEARVQRIAETVSAGDDIVSPSTTGLGRRFKIISLRWLNHSDL